MSRRHSSLTGALLVAALLPPAQRWREPDPFPGALGFVPDP